MKKYILNKYMFLKRINKSYFINFLNKYKINKLFFILAKKYKRILSLHRKKSRRKKKEYNDVFSFFRVDVIQRPLVYRRKTKYCRYFFFRQFFKSFYGYFKVKLLKKLSRRCFFRKRPAIAFLRLFETRLDIFLFRLGLVRSAISARQFIQHGNVMVNNRVVRDYSYSLQVGEPVTFKKEIIKEIKKKVYINLKNNFTQMKVLPSYIEVDYKRFCFNFGVFEKVEEVPFPFRITE